MHVLVRLMEGLFAQASAVLQAKGAAKDAAGTPSRLQYEALVSLRQLPAEPGRLLHRVRSEGVELSASPRGLAELQGEIARGSGRIALALVALGLYVAASLLTQHGLGPRWGDVPVLALGFLAALGLTWRLLRDISRTRG